ncbi:interleukin-1 receptor-like 1 isoform X2 [Gadus morhua]|uniref:interleukin-1 receptor-like 1 isoform X2 n=1 Tax=Gadus morhua TaxID=8049 RepID=UPI0011B7C684|nr:interleukin-1 receptor-like 1 isoform X2 [Gadus morhua]
MSSWEMMKLLVLLLVFCWMACVEGDEGKAEPPGSTCEMYTDMKTFFVTEGEALRIVPDGLQGSNWNDSQHDLFTWHRQDGETNFSSSEEEKLVSPSWHRQEGETNFSSSEEERIHQHGPALFFLPLSINDTGHYIARLDYLGKCHIFYVPLLVTSDPLETFYTPIESSDSNPQVPCPEQVTDVCKDFRGVLSWYQNSSLMVGEKLPTLQLQGHTMPYMAVYKCVCTWKHNEKPYNSTASRELKMMEQPANQDIQIILPTTTELTVHPGSPLEIQCVAFFETNFKSPCEVRWEKNNHSISGMEGYQQTFFRETVESSKKSFCSSTLTIEKVQGSDLQTSFRCRASNHRETRFHTLSLKLAESRSYLVVAVVCVSFVFLLAALTIKYFFMDLVLFGRRFLKCCKASSDGLLYDIYVVYHYQEKSEGILNRFLSQALPHVLEQKCGYRVFTHGPNDTPRADRLEVVKEYVRLCRRLMVVLPPGLEIHETLGSSPSSPVGDDVEWQVGLHEALAQDTRVILVQLGEVGPQGYTHLSPTLQNFIHKRSPLCWLEDSPGAADWNSRFWKRVRYEMPVVSAKPSSLSVL